jgi:hypothetical protein
MDTPVKATAFHETPGMFNSLNINKSNIAEFRCMSGTSAHKKKRRSGMSEAPD